MVLCKAIVAQQISVVAADTITARFYALFEGGSPTPEEIMKLSDANLRGVGLSRQKVSYLRDLSRHFYENYHIDLVLDALQNAAHMLKKKHVGPASYCLNT